MSGPKTVTLPRQKVKNRRNKKQPTSLDEKRRQDEIRERAYRKWEDAGCPEGDGLEFWLHAESELICGAQAESETSKT